MIFDVDLVEGVTTVEHVRVTKLFLGRRLDDVTRRDKVSQESFCAILGSAAFKIQSLAINNRREIPLAAIFECKLNVIVDGDQIIGSIVYETR